jgi:hypothetical protein
MNRIAFESPTTCRVLHFVRVGLVVMVILFPIMLLPPLWNVYSLVALLAMVVLLVLYWRRLPWHLRLESHSVWIGATPHGHGHWVPYESIRFLALTDATTQAGGRMTRLTIETERHRYSLELSPDDAPMAIDELRARSRHASGVTTEGDAFLASDLADRERGAHRVVQVMVWRVVGWAVPGFLVLGGMAYIGQDRLLAHPGDLVGLCSVGALAFGKAAEALGRIGQPAEVNPPRSTPTE